ncbi:glycosyltransferase family 4 protein [Microbacterium sp. LRZ72]|uniref:glycosyltransferase family 4 protein n=1 Tax=Microbacterium sp. LRZ72 TaxID=2942481 RepID=UPI0029A7F594|nr:glycosyltransferase family 4 protein [Microbacterium sp. LRZ72]MDX2377455.1 glycosyltransferase family 4 protein [Microbacterium sp. LRZ72]
MPDQQTDADHGSRVLFVHPGAEMFGSDRMLLESVRGAVQAGADVVVALPQQGPLVPHLREAGASVVLVPMLVLRKSLLRPRGWAQLVRDTVRGFTAAIRLLTRLRPAAVYISTITLPQWPLAARLGRTVVVSHVHEAEASAHRLVNAALYAPLHAATAVIVNSRFTRETMTAVAPRLSGRTRVVENAVAAPPRTVPARLDLEGSLRVVYLGRLSPRKGPDVAIEAARELARGGVDVDLTVVGAAFAGYEWFEGELRRLAQMEPRVRVTFTGFESDVWPRLAAADVLVVPSRGDESFGNTAVEGILAGRPVVASDTSGLREAAGGYPTAFHVTPGDVEALSAALRRIYDDWSSIHPDLGASAARAHSLHAPERYRTSVATVVREATRRQSSPGRTASASIASATRLPRERRPPELRGA